MTRAAKLGQYDESVTLKTHLPTTDDHAQHKPQLREAVVLIAFREGLSDLLGPTNPVVRGFNLPRQRRGDEVGGSNKAHHGAGETGANMSLVGGSTPQASSDEGDGDVIVADEHVAA